MQCSIDSWPEGKPEDRIEDERLAKRLRKSYFRLPPIDKYHPVPFVRFPRWLFCPACRTLKPVEYWQDIWSKASNKEFRMQCGKCDDKGYPVLVPSRFIAVCEHGHIDDFPWVTFVHHGDACQNPDLEIRTVGSTVGLEGIEIKCNTCKKPRRMTGTFDSDFFRKNLVRNGSGIKCRGNQPCYDTAPVPCECYPRTAQRGGTNVYFPQIITSILIPPYSGKSTTAIEGHALYQYIETLHEPFSDPMIAGLYQRIAMETQVSVAEVEKIIRRKFDKTYVPEDEDTEIRYRDEEYRVFNGNFDEEITRTKDFDLRIADASRYGIFGLTGVSLVHRLREIRALMAFSRLEPLERGDSGILDDQDDDDRRNPIAAVPVSASNSLPWLPALEVRGEGIFLHFDIAKLDEWLASSGFRERLASRPIKINDRFRKFLESRGRRIRPINPKFVFLHSLAHILIRQLTFECGYSGSSLRERIYCNEMVTQPSMSGILIYTASGDSEGTLGGLVRQGQPDTLKKILLRGLAKASWCSNDPICRDSDGQGMHSLNMAACHACLLLSETSCEEQNRFLDRQLVLDFFKPHFDAGEVVAI
jgi:hypothetical protein